MSSKEIFLQRLYNRSGMMCDETFNKWVYDEMVEIFSSDDLRHPSSSFDVEYDGSFEVVVTDFRLNGKDYWVFKVYPLMDCGVDTLECVCGEAWIAHADWEEVLNMMEQSND